MRVTWSTDLHLNFLRSKRDRLKFYHAVKDENPDVYIITGDIGVAQDFTKYLEEISDVLGSTPVYFNLGNHDFYHCHSIKETRSTASDLSQTRSLHYLQGTGSVRITNNCTLVGVDGWGDAANGDYMRPTMRLNDFNFIPELTDKALPALHAVLRRFGEIEAELLKSKLDTVTPGIQNLIVATHVPPFEDAAWHLGRKSDPGALPYFSCKATGVVLDEFAKRHPDINITVLCGHCHSEGVYKHCDNMIVYTGGAEYYKPKVQKTIDVF